jgi:hypothetical protein
MSDVHCYTLQTEGNFNIIKILKFSKLIENEYISIHYFLNQHIDIDIKDKSLMYTTNKYMYYKFTQTDEDFKYFFNDNYYYDYKYDNKYDNISEEEEVIY